MAGRIVYSSGIGRLCPDCGWSADDCHCASTLRAGKEPLAGKPMAKLRLEKRASGKNVTVVEGLPDNPDLLARLAKEWKKACGTGGSTGSGLIELQGDQRERLRELLEKKGWRVKG
jgi:translation initiation factor 1